MGKKRAKKAAKVQGERKPDTRRLLVDLGVDQVEWLDGRAAGMGLSRSQFLRLLLVGCMVHDQAMQSPGTQRLLSELIGAAVDAGARAAAAEGGAA